MDRYDVIFYLRYIRDKIAIIYDDSTLCQQYAWWILQAICGKTSTELICQKTLMMTEQQKQQIDLWIGQLIDEHKPLQYILGSVPFADLDILVEPPILIPRPETEEWTLHIIEYLLLLENKNITILDLATGSGCIAIAFAHYLPMAKVVATDIADAALKLTEKNIEHNTLRNITSIKSDLFTSIPIDQQFDLIVSNPPYIAFSEMNDLDIMVSKWEDPNALFAEDNGLAIIKHIIMQAPDFIKSNEEMKNKNIPQLVIEIGQTQGQTVKNYMIDAGYNDVLVCKDLEGKDRFVIGRVDHVANSKLRS